MEHQPLKHGLTAIILTSEDVTLLKPKRRGRKPMSKQEKYLKRWTKQVEGTPEYERRINWVSPF